METVKEILTENRDSVISSIKYIFKVYRSEDVVFKMKEFLAFAEGRLNIEYYNSVKGKKTYLKDLVALMARQQERESNIRIYGTANPKLADIMGKIADHEEEQGNEWNPVAREWQKAKY